MSTGSAADGGVFAVDAPFHGSSPELRRPTRPEGRRIRAVADGAGYYILGTDGRVSAFGAAIAGGGLGTGQAVDLVLAAA